MPLASGGDPAPFRESIGNMFLDLGERLGIDQGPLIRRAFEPVSHAQSRHRRHQFGCESVVHRTLHQQPVGAHAGLAGIAILAGDGARDRRIEIGVLEHDERRVASQLEREFFHRGGALHHQLLADAGRARERDLAHRGVAGHLCADRRGILAGDEVQHSRRDPGPRRQLRHRQRGVGRLARRFAHERAARSQGRRRLARDHGRRKIPGRDGRNDTNRLAQHQQALVGLMRWNDLPVQAFAFLGEPLDEGGGVADLAPGFRERLALLGGHDGGEIFAMLEHQVEPTPEDDTAILRRARRPSRKSRLGRGDRASRFGRRHVGYGAQRRLGCRIDDCGRGAGVRADPFAADVGLRAQQAGVFEVHGAARVSRSARKASVRVRARPAAAASKLGR